MKILIEVCMYLIVVWGIICTTITVFNTDSRITSKYIRKKNNNTAVELELRFTGESDEVIQDTSYALANGKFSNIYDLVDEFKVYKKDK